MQTRDIIVVGASAGGVTALKQFVQALPENFRASIFIVLHTPAYSESRLPWILSNVCALEAVHPSDGDEIMPGKIYVAPPDHHLLVDDTKVLVKRGPKENRFRPSIDALFRSAAYTFGTRVIGIILSGLLDDGVSGLWTIKAKGGIAIVQLPEDAEQPQLPLNALEYVDADYTVRASEMAVTINNIIYSPPAKAASPALDLKRLITEIKIAGGENAFDMDIMKMGKLSPFTCPECHGVLVSLPEGNTIRFRCHTGHAYSAASLLSELSEANEHILWQSVRAMEEMTMLLKHIGDHYKELEQTDVSLLFYSKANESEARAKVLHDVAITITATNK